MKSSEMEYVGLLWLLVPIIVIAAAIVKWLFWLLLIALLFTADDTHLKKGRIIVFIAITLFVLVVVISEKSYHFIGVAYAIGGLLTYTVFHFISGAINKSEKRRKQDLKSKDKINIS
jgi:predicted membrane protein